MLNLRKFYSRSRFILLSLGLAIALFISTTQVPNAKNTVSAVEISRRQKYKPGPKPANIILRCLTTSRESVYAFYRSSGVQPQQIRRYLVAQWYCQVFIYSGDGEQSS
ncbi:hypothetical protein I8752_13715 [Nostocaceae cyanobacterium CENA369]|uniref:Uncharacterized protein n=1 Tax=Dendronalium phyllosphericum CENA369 TaxID=1725256 RepID=A0A8J7I5B0_9NOST|nr:hypothetical protein [Dendronalium phyllosphericum]MBH8574058.1 hypothetical protein [Dendronalium phyllosphericum CENA369]